MRILYVEDEKFLADAVKHNLEKQGITVDLAADGEIGLDQAVKDIYDCIVLDIMLPKLSGTDILKHLREKKIQTPIIMLSALSEVESKIEHLDKGADDYLAKPTKLAKVPASASPSPKPFVIKTTGKSLAITKTNSLLLPQPSNHPLMFSGDKQQRVIIARSPQNVCNQADKVYDLKKVKN